MVDLHLHSTFSDGSEEPETLVAQAAAAGLSALSLTDHDTTRGCAPFAAAAYEKGIRTVTGVEISVENPDGELHILGIQTTWNSNGPWSRSGVVGTSATCGCWRSYGIWDVPWSTTPWPP